MKKVQEGGDTLKDKRSPVAKDREMAQKKDKNQMLRQMLKRAVGSIISFTHVIADSWFGNKENIKAVVSLGLAGCLRMKRGNLQYFFNGKPYTATELYAFVKRRMRKLKGSPWKTRALTVFLDTSDDKDDPGEIIELIKERLSVGISGFLDQALQLDDNYLRSELKAEKIGAFQN